MALTDIALLSIPIVSWYSGSGGNNYQTVGFERQNRVGMGKVDRLNGSTKLDIDIW